MKAVIIKYKLPLLAILEADTVKEGTAMLAKGLKQISEVALKDTALDALQCEIVYSKSIEIPDDAKTEDINIVDDTIEIEGTDTQENKKSSEGV